MTRPPAGTDEPRRDLLGWIGAALAAASWCWLQPRHAPAAGGLQAGLVMVVLGALLLFLAGARRGRAGLGFFLALTAGVGLLALETVLAHVEAVVQPAAQPFSWIAWAVARGAGYPAVVERGGLLLNDSQGAFTFSPTWSLTAFPSLLLFWALGGVLVLVRERRIEAFGRLVLVPFLFFGLRYAFFVLALAGADDALASKSEPALMMFWKPGSVLLTLLAAAVAVAAAERPLAWAARGSGSLALRATSLALVAGLSLGAAVSWQDPGSEKPGRVLVDDRLTGYWEPAGRLLETERYGDFSTYSLAAMVEHLSRRFTVTVNGDLEYTREYLDGFDVLILKTPESGLTPAEVRSIQDWVLAGGGLLAISDHTDLNGMSSFLNEVVRRFGFEFQFDATSNVVHGGFDYWIPPLIPEHPISAGLGPFECMTACSIRLSLDARPVMTLRQSMSTGGDYAGSSNFGSLAPDPSRPHGELVLAGAAEWDAGRVVAFSDSTVLSSFAYYTWGHSDFILRAITWLNRRNTPWYWLRWGFGILGAVLLLLAARSLLPGTGGPGGAPGGLASSAACMGLGFLLGAWGTGQLAARALTVPAPTADAVRVGFVIEGGHAWLPAVLGTQPDLPPHGNLQTFVQTPQRLGYETRVVPRDPALLADLDVLVLLNPDVEEGQPEAPAGWIEAVDRWVDQGGRLLVLARREHWGHEHDRAPLYLRETNAWEEQASGLEGVTLTAADQGRGRVVLLLGSEEFDLQGMGHCMAYPGRSERQRYDVAYRVFGELLGVQPPERRSYRP